MKIGAKEMKKAYKDVKLDQIDVRLLFVNTLFLLPPQQMDSNGSVCTGYHPDCDLLYMEAYIPDDCNFSLFSVLFHSQ